MSGIGFIPFSEIVKYLDEARIVNLSEREEYIKWIQFIDKEDVTIMVKKQKSKKPKKPPAPSRRRR